MIDPRQSTTVPNVSKTRALVDCATAAMGLCPRASVSVSAAAPAPSAHANCRRLKFIADLNKYTRIAGGVQYYCLEWVRDWDSGTRLRGLAETVQTLLVD